MTDTDRQELEEAVLSLHYGAEMVQVRNGSAEACAEVHRLAATAAVRLTVAPNGDGLAIWREV